MKITESSYNWSNGCFMAIVSFYKPYKTFKHLSFSLKWLSRVFWKMGVALHQKWNKMLLYNFKH